MLRPLTFGILLITSLALAIASPGENNEDAIGSASAVLDALHDAASKADGQRYFDLFAPDAVFLGTDAAERWTIDEFRAYAMKRFGTGTGWTYTLRPNTRHITLSDDGDFAWFDELLDNAKYGVCRGTGVLRKVTGDPNSGGWKIAQYNLTLTVPNEVAADVVKVIRQHAEGPKD